MRTIVALLLLTSLASAQTVEQRLDALEARVSVVEAAVGIADPDPPVRPDVPSVWIDPMGVPIYLVGHSFENWAVKSGSWNDPTLWASGKVPSKNDAVAITDGITVTLSGEVRAKTILCRGCRVELVNGADVLASTILGVDGAKWTAGTEDAPIGYTLTTFGTPFEDGDTSQLGNGFIWHGHGNFHQYGFSVPDDGTHEWYASNGVRGDARYATGRPPDSTVAVDLDSNSIQWRWDGTGNAPHGMLMHGSGDMSHTTIRWRGRTDKSRLLGPDNLLARYTWHFHRGGEEHVSHLDHCIFAGSVGWGCDNHSSNVVATDCACVDCYGAGFVCEAANEVGEWTRCIAIGMRSSEFPNRPYARVLANDRWFSGEGIVGAARVKITDCVCADVGVGVGFNNIPLPQLIGGEVVQLDYADGTDPRYADQLPVSRVKVHGYELFGVWSHWNNGNGDTVPTPLTECEFRGGGPKSVGILHSYGSGWDVRNCVIEADIGSVEQNIGPTTTMRYTDCEFHVRWANDAKPGASMHTTEWINGTINASDVGIRCVASTHSDCRRIYRITGTAIHAPDELQLIYDDPPFTQYTDANQVNEAWRDGVRALFPWQDQ